MHEFADAWHLRGEVFCNGSLHKSCVQEREFWHVMMPGIYVVKFFAVVHSTRVLCMEGEFWRMLMPGIYVVKFFAMVNSTRVLCRKESSGVC
jgi:hypothetical protein